MKMKKAVLTAVVLCLAANIIFAQEVFLSMTKYADDLEKLPTNVTVISQEKIQESHASDIGELLESEAGITGFQNGTKGDMQAVFIRGAANSARTLVLIDGRKINNASSGGADTLAAIPLSMVERIEIIRGAGAALYGAGAFGGVINIITKKSTPLSPLAEIGLSGGERNTLNPSGNIGLNFGPASLFLGYAHYQTDGYRYAPDPANPAGQKHSDYTDDNFLFNGSVNLGENQTLSLSANKYNADFQYPGSLIFGDLGKRKDDAYYLKADYEIKILEDMNLKVSAYQSDNKTDNFDESAYSNGNHDISKNEVAGAQLNLIWRDLTVGGEYGKENWTGDVYDYDAFPAERIKMKKDRDNTAAFVQYNFVMGQLRLLPTLRYDNNSVYGDFISPALSAIVNTEQNIKFSINISRVWRAPTFNDLYYPNNSNPDLKPEDGVSTDIGIEWANSKIKIAGTFFHIESDNLIVSEADIFYHYIPYNISKARQMGFEFEAGYMMFSFLSHRFNYTYLEAQDISGAKQSERKDLPYSPKNSVNYTLNVKPISDLSISAVLHYRDVYLSGSKWMKENITLDLLSNYKVNKNFAVWLKVINAGDLEYQVSNGYPMPRRTVYAGIDVKFLK